MSLKNIDPSYKEERLLIRNLNLIQVTGKLYRSDSGYFELIHDTCQMKDYLTGVVVSGVVLRDMSDSDKILFCISKQSFMKNFHFVKEQLA